MLTVAPGGRWPARRWPAGAARLDRQDRGGWDGASSGPAGAVRSSGAGRGSISAVHGGHLRAGIRSERRAMCRGRFWGARHAFGTRRSLRIRCFVLGIRTGYCTEVESPKWSPASPREELCNSLGANPQIGAKALDWPGVGVTLVKAAESSTMGFSMPGAAPWGCPLGPPPTQLFIGFERESA
jgi:hypothetical protein